MSEPYDYLLKFIVIGSAGTGKSCILHKFIENKFKEDSTQTIGVEFGQKVIQIGGKEIKIQTWDTAGQERFRALTRSYYRGVAAALLVYDISRESFNSISQWLSDARSLSPPHVVILLVGNKRDLEAEREVTFTEASQFAQDNELLFFETSAMTGENVEDTFVKCAQSVISKIQTGEIDAEAVGSGIKCGRKVTAPSAATSSQPFLSTVLAKGKSCECG